MPLRSPTRTLRATGAGCVPTSSSFHGDSESVRVSIVDPHGHHLADALPKLRGLAEFAATHGEFFHRIESVAEMKAGTLRVLDLTKPSIRKAIREAQDIKALYLGDGANDY